MKIVLISTYELGRQPFGLASPAAWLRRGGHSVCCADLSVGALPVLEVREADVVCFYLPMHTATRLAAPLIGEVRRLNSRAHICCYGLYAPLNAEYLRNLGAQTILGGEFEAELSRLPERLSASQAEEAAPLISLDRLKFVPPDRQGMPALTRYPKLVLDGQKLSAGYTEASRGCKHRCRHCPVVPVYDGVFRIVPVDVVLEDIRRQVETGARHISFGDPDFWNGPVHARRIVERLHREFPNLTYDVTIKIEHLLQHREALDLLKRTGCLFVISAVESVDDEVLHKLDKGHTRRDFLEVARMCRERELTLSPTFIPFTPWTTTGSYRELLETIEDTGLIENVSPVQLTLRLLITSGSRLLELPEIRSLAHEYDSASLCWRWQHSDPEVDALARDVLQIVNQASKRGQSRRATFLELLERVHGQRTGPPLGLQARTTIPYMEEPWFC